MRERGSGGVADGGRGGVESASAMGYNHHKMKHGQNGEGHCALCMATRHELFLLGLHNITMRYRYRYIFTGVHDVGGPSAAILSLHP